MLRNGERIKISREHLNFQYNTHLYSFREMPGLIPQNDGAKVCLPAFLPTKAARTLQTTPADIYRATESSSQNLSVTFSGKKNACFADGEMPAYLKPGCNQSKLTETTVQICTSVTDLMKIKDFKPVQNRSIMLNSSLKLVLFSNKHHMPLGNLTHLISEKTN